jgi:VanZ family protein
MNLARLWWGLGAVLMILATIVCLVPQEHPPQAFELNDKVSHLIGHGTLALYFAGLVPRARWWSIFALLLLFGITIEVSQHYMNLGREGDLRDVAANSVGALLGLVAARLGLARWPEFAAWLLGRRSEAR